MASYIQFSWPFNLIHNSQKIVPLSHLSGNVSFTLTTFQGTQNLIHNSQKITGTFHPFS